MTNNSIDSELGEILSDLIYDTPNHYGYPPDFEPDFKKALQAIKALYRKEVEEAIRLTWNMSGEGWNADYTGVQYDVEEEIVKAVLAKLLPPTKGEKL